MKTLRKVHLVLGCFFAPLLMFFAVSGIWQCFYRQYGANGQEPDPNIVLLSTLHTGRALKSPAIHGVSTLSSSSTRLFAAIMAGMLILNMLLGVLMAWRLGHRRAVIVASLMGAIVPAVLVWLATSR
jgi:hypothetical protein